MRAIPCYPRAPSPGFRYLPRSTGRYLPRFVPHRALHLPTFMTSRGELVDATPGVASTNSSHPWGSVFQFFAPGVASTNSSHPWGSVYQFFAPLGSANAPTPAVHQSSMFFSKFVLATRICTHGYTYAYVPMHTYLPAPAPHAGLVQASAYD